jgi:hypothetical protein
LRYTTMQSFKRQLADKVAFTYQKSIDDPTHSTFLKNFGTFKIANLHTEEVKSDQLLMCKHSTCTVADFVDAREDRLLANGIDV